MYIGLSLMDFHDFENDNWVTFTNIANSGNCRALTSINLEFYDILMV